MEPIIKLALNSNFAKSSKSIAKKHGVKITVAADLTPTATGTLRDIKNYVLECNENDLREWEDILDLNRS